MRTRLGSRDQRMGTFQGHTDYYVLAAAVKIGSGAGRAQFACLGFTLGVKWDEEE